jgi:predicted nucleotidyltransferase
LIQDLEDLLGKKVDVATVKGLREVWRDRILNEAVSL